MLVVWRARSSEGSVVVGWYKHATVYRQLQKPLVGRAFSYKGRIIRPKWIIKAKAKDAFLVPTHNRLFKVPVTHKGFGSQTFVSFLDSETAQVQMFVRKLLEHIDKAEKGIFTSRKKGKRGSVDQTRKLRVERAAIDAVSEYYSNRGYDVKSVETENLGYDLIATYGTRKLLIEVKGTSLGNDDSITVNLSPNEYRKSRSKRKRYRICIVTNALNKPSVHEFIWSDSNGCWEDENNGETLSVAEVTSANLTISI